MKGETTNPTPEQKMRAFIGTEVTKSRLIESLEKHAAADAFAQGTYGERVGKHWRGCAVGCSLHDFRPRATNDHSLYEPLFGVPEGIARLEDAIFEGLPIAEAKAWPLRFAQAVPEGADLSRVLPAVLYRIMQRRRDALAELVVPEDPARAKVLDAVEQVRVAMDQTLAVIAKWRDTGEMDTSAADSASSAADSAWSAAASARSAAASARSAADSAWSSAASARSAAASARSAAASARSAADSAWSSAASAGGDPTEAKYAEYRWVADVLIEEMGRAPVEDR